MVESHVLRARWGVGRLQRSMADSTTTNSSFQWPPAWEALLVRGRVGFCLQNSTVDAACDEMMCVGILTSLPIIFVLHHFVRRSMITAVIHTYPLFITGFPG